MGGGYRPVQWQQSRRSASTGQLGRVAARRRTAFAVAAQDMAGGAGGSGGGPGGGGGGDEEAQQWNEDGDLVETDMGVSLMDALLEDCDEGAGGLGLEAAAGACEGLPAVAQQQGDEFMQWLSGASAATGSTASLATDVACQVAALLKEHLQQQQQQQQLPAGGDQNGVFSARRGLPGARGTLAIA